MKALLQRAMRIVPVFLALLLPDGGVAQVEVVPSVGEVGTSTAVTIAGEGITADTRVALFPGEEPAVVGTYTAEGSYYGSSYQATGGDVVGNYAYVAMSGGVGLHI